MQIKSLNEALQAVKRMIQFLARASRRISVLRGVSPVVRSFDTNGFRLADEITEG